MKTPLIKIAGFVCLAAFLSGCALMTADVGALYEMEKAHMKTFEKDVPYCYNMTLKAIEKWNASVFQQRRGDYIVAMGLTTLYGSSIDTTEVGIFFTETAPGKTEIKVASLNYSLSEVVARNLFTYIEKGGKE